ncbi:MAG: hypothetical protein WCF43_02705 [Steroidobacteraceae bacterium]
MDKFHQPFSFWVLTQTAAPEFLFLGEHATNAQRQSPRARRHRGGIDADDILDRLAWRAIRD